MVFIRPPSEGTQAVPAFGPLEVVRCVTGPREPALDQVRLPGPRCLAVTLGKARPPA